MNPLLFCTRLNSTENSTQLNKIAIKIVLINLLCGVMNWRTSWSKLRQRSALLKTWTYYNFNLLRYNLQWCISVLRHGERTRGAQVPFMVTVKMQKSLSRLGFQEEDIRMLKPAEAAKIIEHSVKKQTWKELRRNTSRTKGS